MPAFIESVLSLTKFYRSINIDNYVYGGWALDLHLQRQTRLHEDIDNFIPHEQRNEFIAFLSSMTDATIIHDAPYKTTWTSFSITPHSYVETHYYQIDNDVVSLGYPKDWMRAPINVFTSVPYFPHKGDDDNSCSESIPVVSKELVVAMCERWGVHESDRKHCKELKSKCNPRILSKIHLKEFY